MDKNAQKSVRKNRKRAEHTNAARRRNRFNTPGAASSLAWLSGAASMSAQTAAHTKRTLSKQRYRVVWTSLRRGTKLERRRSQWARETKKSENAGAHTWRTSITQSALSVALSLSGSAEAPVVDVSSLWF